MSAAYVSRSLVISLESVANHATEVTQIHLWLGPTRLQGSHSDPQSMTSDSDFHAESLSCV